VHVRWAAAATVDLVVLQLCCSRLILSCERKNSWTKVYFEYAGLDHHFYLRLEQANLHLSSDHHHFYFPTITKKYNQLQISQYRSNQKPVRETQIGVTGCLYTVGLIEFFLGQVEFIIPSIITLDWSASVEKVIRKYWCNQVRWIYHFVQKTLNHAQLEWREGDIGYCRYKHSLQQKNVFFSVLCEEFII